jgi:sugar phosphate isomerase/epimerase
VSECRDAEAYIRRINAFASRAKNAGFTFSYHNHGHEFIKLDCGETAMALFLKGFDAETVDFMPDTYWLHDGCCDVRYFLEKTRNRVRILHLKDMKRIEQGHTFTEVGNGNLYFEGIIKTAIDCGINEFVVEQDICEGNPLDSLKISYDHIKNILEG